MNEFISERVWRKKIKKFNKCIESQTKKRLRLKLLFNWLLTFKVKKLKGAFIMHGWPWVQHNFAAILLRFYGLKQEESARYKHIKNSLKWIQLHFLPEF